MKLIIATNRGRFEIRYEIQVGDDISLQEIKEKVETVDGTPISEQTLIFNGNILGHDELYLLKDESVIHLIRPRPRIPKTPDKFSSSNPEMPVVEDAENQRVQPQEIAVYLPPQKKSKTTASSSSSQFNLAADNTIAAQMLSPPMTESTGSSRSQPPPTGNIMIRIELHFRGERRVTEVNPAHKVSELKTKLPTLFNPFPERTIFTHKQELMDERLSFASYNVAEGDVIEIFEGHVTVGDYGGD